MNEFFDAFFIRQRRWGQDLRNIDQGSKKSMKAMLNFNYEKPGCAIKLCRIPENIACMRKYLAE